MKKIRFNWRKWCDEFVLAGKGILLATKERKFWVGFIIAFLFFGTLMNLLSNGLTKFELMGALGFPKNLRIIAEAIVGIFGVNMIFSNWIFVFFISLLQGILIGLIVLLWNKKNRNSENVQKVGIITGLIALGAGCPTCGTTLITPFLGMIFSTGSLAIAGVVSSVVTVLAVVIAILSLKRMGLEMYAIIINEKYLAKKAKRVEELDGNEREVKRSGRGR
ncbi:hypothetical protein IKT18_01550 [Candidatus Saccharibacteria bacterium]|nr:hypothetical protein [Candidatus Saccharibacteria bacterium]